MHEVKMRLFEYITQDVNFVYGKDGIIRFLYRFVFIPYFKIIVLYRLLKHLRDNNHQLLGGNYVVV